MQIVVINATGKHGITYRLKELFLERFRETAEITEYDLPKDCPAFCTGCTNCFLAGESACKDAAHIQKIVQSLVKADLIVMTSPAYVFHTTGAMKALLDHLAYLWMPHRPAPEMFKKRAVVITQCLGSGAKSAAKDIRHSLAWWGISDIKSFTGKLMGGIVWDQLPEKKRTELSERIRVLSSQYDHINYTRPARTGLTTKTKFFICRMLQKNLHNTEPENLDGKYWAELGWLEKARPWKL